MIRAPVILEEHFFKSDQLIFKSYKNRVILKKLVKRLKLISQA